MTILHRKRKSLRKESRAMATMVCLLSLAVMAAGCGKVEEPVSVDLSSGNMEELQGGTPEEAAGETEQLDAENGNSESDTPENEQPNKESGSSTVQDDNGQQSVGSAELSGNVYSLGQDSFVVCREETWSEGDADMAVAVAPGYEKEEDLITVYVSGNCSYQYKTVKNGGINPEDISVREGNFADLQEGILVDMKGSWQDDNSFRADSIVMSSIE